MHWYLDVLKKYAVFNGRASRAEFWMFFLFNFIIAIVLAGVDAYLNTPGVLGAIYGLATLLPYIGVAIRRLHDTGRSGWWLLIALVPCVGAIVLIVFLVGTSQPGTNPYGPPPGAAAPSFV
jgi:uncharacterized membrane protein YhaH (DUF805 family)